MANHRNRSARCVTAYATRESPANGNVQANVRRTGSTAGMRKNPAIWGASTQRIAPSTRPRSEEHTSELQSRLHLVCRLLLEKKKQQPSMLHMPRYLPLLPPST